jgi:hypothetical protein
MTKELKAKRVRYSGSGILKNRVTEEVYSGNAATKCLNCEATIKKEQKHIVVRNKKDKVRARFCGRDCQQTYEHQKLEEYGFYK